MRLPVTRRIAERPVEFGLQHARQWLVVVAVTQAFEQRGLVEHILAAVHVELPYLVDRHATGDAGSDDRAGTGAAGEVEPIGQDQLRIPGQPAQVPFDGAQNLDRHHAEDPATVACQDLLRARCSNSFT